MKSPRNKTINISEEEGRELLDLCRFPRKDLSCDDIRDRYFHADFFTAVKYLPEKSFDLIIADPPYNLRKDYGGEVWSKKNPLSYEDFTRKWLEAVKPLLKDNGSIYVCCDWETSIIAGKVLGEFFNIKNRITWQREKGRGAKTNWKNSMEDIWFCTNSDTYTFNLNAVKIRKRVIAPYKENGQPKDWTEESGGNFRMTCPSNFWDDITVPFWSMSENTAHPTQKPEKLFAKLILASSNRGDMIFDPFGGSGTTAVTAKKLGRHFTCTEKTARYCIWAQQRLKNADEDKSIQGYKDGVFYERNVKAPGK